MGNHDGAPGFGRFHARRHSESSVQTVALPTRRVRNVWDGRSSVASDHRIRCGHHARGLHYSPMRFRLRSFRRLVPLALPCWLLGGPLATTLHSVAACPHHDAMPSSMDHGSGTKAPCWCADMSGAAALEVPTLSAAEPESAAPITSHPVVAVALPLQSLALPDSPSFPPAPPPPNARA